MNIKENWKNKEMREKRRRRENMVGRDWDRARGREKYKERARI